MTHFYNCVLYGKNMQLSSQKIYIFVLFNKSKTVRGKSKTIFTVSDCF